MMETFGNASEEVHATGDSAIGTEHLLLGLCTLKDRPFSQFLQRAGVKPDDLRAYVRDNQKPVVQSQLSTVVTLAICAAVLVWPLFRLLQLKVAAWPLFVWYGLLIVGVLVWLGKTLKARKKKE